MAGAEFDVKELSEYAELMIEFASDEFPKTIVKFMKKEAGELQKVAKQRAKATVDKKTGNYIKGFKKGRKVYEYQDVQYNIRVYNSAPHAHLIEYGHEMVTKSGARKGFVRGFHVLEHASLSFENRYASDIETELVKMIDEELGK